MPFAMLLLASPLLLAAPTDAWQPPEGAAREALVSKYVRDDGEPGFFRAMGGAYIVKTDVGREFALDAACFLERFRSQFRHVFRDPVAERYPPLVVIYKDEARYRRAIGGGASRGMFIAAQRTLFTYLDAAKGERDFGNFYAKILLHEGAHQLLHALCGAPPLWFDEGVASYFQEWDVRRPVDEDLELLRGKTFRFKDLREAFGTERWVPLKRLLALEGAAWAPDDFGPRTNLHYAEAASFVSFLVATKPGQRTFTRIYETLRDGHDLGNVLNTDTTRALDAGWKEDLAARIAAAAAAEGETSNGGR